MKMSSRPWCYRCMHLPVEQAGMLCRRCEEGWEPRRPSSPDAMKPLDQWTLEELIATQEQGTVPGDAMFRRHETPFSDLGMQ